jgi:hypothetical protein
MIFNMSSGVLNIAGNKENHVFSNSAYNYSKSKSTSELKP